ncbi:uncharacterized protein LOC143257444 isoform X1 [Tachypleus tridentatus]|uniref:uncharacterized protein LOC143257444 isoform X1 n=1 Tax=Tachypleus tridentatus TaxID=6853 RepID=UPI003FD64766
MVYCVAYGCKNGSTSGKSFFTFPCKEKEPARWRQWVRMVNRKNWTPSHHAKLCQDHFERSCFVSDPTVLDSVGFKPGRLILKKPSAVDRIVPTIFPRVELRTDLSLLRTGSTPLKPSLAITKRTNLKPVSSIPRGTQTGWYSVYRGVQVFPSGLKTVATQTENLPIIDFAYGAESSPAAKKSSVSQVTDADDVYMNDDEGADPD